MCKVENCKVEKIEGRGLCRKHYIQWREDNAPPCSIHDCSKPAYCKGYCKTHYTRLREHGDVNYEPKILKPFTALNWIIETISKKTDECLIFPYSQTPSGYGYLSYEGSYVRAHRLALSLFTGNDHKGRLACHKPKICHNRLCCNPRHLYWGSHKDNSQDMIIDGTDSRGEKSVKAILTESAAFQIKYKKDTRTRQEIADHYGVSLAAVKAIKSGRTWAWL